MKKFPDNDDFKLNLSSAYREIGEFEKANKIIFRIISKMIIKKFSYFMDYTKDKNNKLKANILNITMNF